MKARLLILALTLVAIATPAEAQLPLGEEFQVNTRTSSNQTLPALAADAGGNFVVVWSSGSIRGQRFDSLGQPLGGEFWINTFIGGYQSFPAVARAAGGEFFVAWASGRSIRGQRYDPAGRALGGELQINSYTTGTQRNPAVALDDDGNAVAVWTSFGQDGDSGGIHGQRFDSLGMAAGGEFQVNSYTTYSQYAPAVATDAAGNFVVVWSSYGAYGLYQSVQGQRYDSTGNAVGGEFQINAYTVDDQVSPAVAMDGNGNFVVVWSTDSLYIRGQRYDSAGVALGGELGINSATKVEQGRPVVAATASGSFVVVWSSYPGPGYDATYLRARRYDSMGAGLGGEFRVNAYTARRQIHPAVAMNAGGGFVVVWSSYDDGSGFGIQGQRYCAGADVGGICIFADGFESGDVTAWSTSAL